MYKYLSRKRPGHGGRGGKILPPGDGARKTPSASCRPTPAGLCWFAAVPALLATAINYGSNLIFALAFVMLSLWLQSAWLCRRNLRGLVWRPAVPSPVFAGEPIGAGGALVEETGARRHALRLVAGSAISPAADLAPGAEIRLEASVASRRRGVQAIGPLALVSDHPFGLWRRRVPLPAMEALVYPSPEGDAPLPLAAPMPAHRRLAADNFQGVRRYAPGDSPRRVNWRVFGRVGELTVNEFDGAQGGEALWLCWEETRGETEARLSQLAAWILAARRDGLEYGLRLGHLRLAPRRGGDHQAACLSALARFDAAARDEKAAA
ncbi:MAG: DUF58 domain-containing protein [Candidatus Accumulibacter sp.]|jgi:uncharacterized protein (DUF58 family)|nr:DUF58 domain-containing protein [Accumulibacter sp.]